MLGPPKSRPLPPRGTHGQRRDLGLRPLTQTNRAKRTCWPPSDTRHALSTLLGHKPAVGICGAASQLPPNPALAPRPLQPFRFALRGARKWREIAMAFREDQNGTWPRANRCSRHCERPRDDAKACCPGPALARRPAPPSRSPRRPARKRPRSPSPSRKNRTAPHRGRTGAPDTVNSPAVTLRHVARLPRADEPPGMPA